MDPTQGSTRPFGLLGFCARLGYAALALLAPELALAMSPVAGLLRRPA
jgi:hypothetical protein